MPRTQELCDFCYKHNVYPDIKVVKPEPKQVGDVLAHLDSKNSDPIRYVIDWTQSA
jgi:D-arabinose 1-dehydrogenase-like Zn-dependent alcohol dehydrogenase